MPVHPSIGNYDNTLANGSLPGILKKKDSSSSAAASTVWTETPQEPRFWRKPL